MVIQGKKMVTGNKIKSLGIIVPCYNEEEVLPKTIKILSNLLNEYLQKGLCSNKSKIVFIDDGSKDRTWQIIKENSEKNKFIEGIKLSRNYGQQNGILSGLAKTEFDMYITIDADLQDDINVMEKMINLYYKGYEIVYGARKSRKTDSFLKRNTAVLFYKFMNVIGIKIIFNHSDFRFLSKKARDSLLKFEERNLFLRGIIPLLGFKSDIVYYDGKRRLAGKTKYSYFSLLVYALNGIISSSVFPLRIVILIGVFTFFISFSYFLFLIYNFYKGLAINLVNFLILLNLILFSTLFLVLGIIGEYIGKIYKEVKRRPRFIVERTTFEDEK